MKVGDVVRNKVAVLGNDPGTRGVVYEVYPDFDDIDKDGVSVIFENGNYDGFSHEEQSKFLEPDVGVKYIPFFVRDYSFTNVMKVTRDFEGGLWSEIFRQPK